METRLLERGRLYAYRERRGAGQPLLKVKLLDVVGRKGRVKVRFEDGPHPGLDEYVHTRQLIAPWGQRHAVLRDEQHQARLDEHAAGSADAALGAAANAVLESSGEPGADVSPGGLAMSETELQRIMDRAGLDGEPARLHPLAFRDRRGTVHLPLEAAVALAQAFAAAEPHTVVGYLDDTEEEMRLRGNTPGERWWHDYLREKAPGYALARRWAGLEQEAELLRREIGRLRGLVASAASELKRSGHEGSARRLLRALEGR
ncbi:hypothetical protein [Solirubrobacter pauli]|nr:hypothetical protein [Solirubrobacter pauli]